jgi:hypothetical protein
MLSKRDAGRLGRSCAWLQDLPLRAEIDIGLRDERLYWRTSMFSQASKC